MYIFVLHTVSIYSIHRVCLHVLNTLIYSLVYTVMWVKQ